MSERHDDDPIYRRLCEQLAALEKQEREIESKMVRLERRWVRTIKQEGSIIQAMTHRMEELRVLAVAKKDQIDAQRREMQGGQG